MASQLSIENDKRSITSKMQENATKKKKDLSTWLWNLSPNRFLTWLESLIKSAWWFSQKAWTCNRRLAWCFCDMDKSTVLKETVTKLNILFTGVKVYLVQELFHTTSKKKKCLKKFGAILTLSIWAHYTLVHLKSLVNSIASVIK